MKILGLIPARGGSKGIPRKNIIDLHGKPLIAWTIETALNCYQLDRVIVSTEDFEIAEVAKKYGADVPFMRPKELAKDSTPGIEPVLHAITLLPEYDWVLLLQPTSPLRKLDDILGIIDFAISHKAESVVSVSESPVHPSWMYQLGEKNRMSKFFNQEFIACRQDLPPAYSINGSLYFIKVDKLVKAKAFVGLDTQAYIMPKERSFDIDDEDDFSIVQKLMFKC